MTTVDREQLVASAQDFAARALRAYLQEDKRVILTDAAFSLEHLCKAFLCAMNPALLMEIRNGQLDSLLHLTGHGTKAKKLKSPRTISAREALSRIEHVLPGLAVPKDRLNQLIDDGVVHIGYLKEKDTRDIFAAYLRLSNELYNQLGVAPDDRWGDHKDMVNSLISESLTEIEREVQHRLNVAKLRYMELKAKVPEEELWTVIIARQAQGTMVPLPGQKMIHAQCPVCQEDYASYFGEVDYLLDHDVEPDGEGGNNAYVAVAICEYNIDRFECGSCELQLRGMDELPAAGLDAILDYDPTPEELAEFMKTA